LAAAIRLLAAIISTSADTAIMVLDELDDELDAFFWLLLPCCCVLTTRLAVVDLLVLRLKRPPEPRWLRRIIVVRNMGGWLAGWSWAGSYACLLA